MSDENTETLADPTPTADVELAAEEAPAVAEAPAPSSVAELHTNIGHEQAAQPVHYAPSPLAPVHETHLDTDRVPVAGDPSFRKVKFLGQTDTTSHLTVAGADGRLRTPEDVFSGHAEA